MIEEEEEEERKTEVSKMKFLKQVTHRYQPQLGRLELTDLLVYFEAWKQLNLWLYQKL